MSLADYLAKNYLTADPSTEKKSKKRKRKGGSGEDSGLIIADDNANGWENLKTSQDEDGPYVVAGRSESKKKPGWKRIGLKAPKDSEQADADAILADVVRENRERARDADDAPVIEGGEDIDMSGYTDSGTKAGLQTSAQVNAAAAKLHREEKKRMKEAMEEAGLGKGETIYRDASGRIINVAMKRAEARKKAEEEERKKREEIEAAKGDAQKVIKEARQQAVKDAKYLTVARAADDVEMNDEMREQDRWNDPAAQFITKKKKGKSVTGKPLYHGSFTPNRFGIRPGYRWDGVDRGIGFEKLWFAARNKKRDRETLEYAWQMDE